jgi:hypothetical protein
MASKEIDFLVTANRLNDGCVVYLASGDVWSEHYADARVTRDPGERDAWIAWAKTRERDVCGAYAIEATVGPSGRVLSARERLRALGRGDARRRLGYPS